MVILVINRHQFWIDRTCIRIYNASALFEMVLINPISYRWRGQFFVAIQIKKALRRIKRWMRSHKGNHDGYLGSYHRSDIPLYEHQAVADDYFRWFKNELGMNRDLTDTGINVNSWIARPWLYEEKYHPTNWVTDRSIDFLYARDRSKPFFLMVSSVLQNILFLQSHQNPSNLVVYMGNTCIISDLCLSRISAWRTQRW